LNGQNPTINKLTHSPSIADKVRTMITLDAFVDDIAVEAEAEVKD
jgi:hypothetical protein